MGATDSDLRLRDGIATAPHDFGSLRPNANQELLKFDQVIL